MSRRLINVKPVHIFIWFIFWGFHHVYGQEKIPIGTWRVHLPYNKTQRIEISNNLVFCSGKYSLFYFDEEDFSVNKLSKSAGFSDVGITAMAYDNKRDITVFGYENGNLDILSGNVIANYDAIKKISTPHRKSILDIDYHTEYAYLTTEFGVFVFRVDRTETKEVYRNLGTEGEHIDLYGAEIYNDSIFLVTESGVIAGSLDPNVNLMDFRNWRRYTDVDGLPVITGKEIVSGGSILYTLMSNENIYYYKSGSWINTDLQFIEDILSVTGYNSGLVITTVSSVYKYTSSGDLSPLNTGPYNHPEMARLDQSERLWIADRYSGLVTDIHGTIESYYPMGPFLNQVKKLIYGEGKIVSVSGGHNEQYEPNGNEEGFSIFENGSWSNYNNSGLAGSNSIPNIKDLIDVNVLGNNITFTSYGNGVIDFVQPDQYTITDAESVNSTLLFSETYDSLTLVNCVSSDKEGNLWFLNFDVSHLLQKRSDNAVWNSYDITAYPNVRFALGFIIPYSGDKWFRLNSDYGGGILVYNEKSDNGRLLYTETGNGGLPSNIVNDLIEDKEGQIWVATAKGVAFYPTSIGIINGGSVDAIIPIFDQRYLLRNEFITAIAIDGGNRKWIGTKQGVWLFNDDGSRLIENFNSENSPIISDYILDIEVNDLTGEVFFATDKGLVSYRGTATQAKETHSNVKIFPNPVTRDFTGIVGIEGLAKDANVKITDISGKLIWETRANGGTATWNVMNYNGQRAATGVYLVFSSTQDGKDTFVGKIVVIN